jgi:hypothetical protein
MAIWSRRSRLRPCRAVTVTIAPNERSKGIACHDRRYRPGRNRRSGADSLDAEAFSSLFAPDGYYTDIAFGVTRRGRENVRENHKIWRMAVPEFSMMPEHAHASGQVVTVQTICYGKFSGSDLGGSKIKATHNSLQAKTKAACSRVGRPGPAIPV